MKKLSIMVLRNLAQRVLNRYHPHTVGITGSYGKTSAKQAIAAVLGQDYAVRTSDKSFNNEFGVPFTILGVSANGSGMRRVLQGFFNGAKLLIVRSAYPTILVLEMGADQPGDIPQLLRLAPLSVGVITGVGPTHLRRFGTLEAVLEEKAQIVLKLPDHGWAVLNGDDPRVRTLGEHAPARVVSYGFQSGVAVRCLDAASSARENGEWGMVLKIAWNTQEFSVFVPGVTGRHSAYAALAAIAVGVAYHLDVVDITDGLRSYLPPPGRMRVLEGIKHTLLIDDSYNSSPDACAAAIEALREFPANGNRYALLGEMADLGTATEPAHRELGTVIVNEKIDTLVTVGEPTKRTAEAAKEKGMSPDRIFSFDDPLSAAQFIQQRIKTGDVVLIKGSQISRMEKAVKELMAEPEKASELLVRQESQWLRT